MSALFSRRTLCAPLLLCVLLGGVWLSRSGNSASAPSPAPIEEEASVPTRAAVPYATVGEWQGKLAVFTADDTAPAAVYDVFIASLPPAEQEALYAGIPVHSEVELQKLLEDYTG